MPRSSIPLNVVAEAPAIRGWSKSGIAMPAVLLLVAVAAAGLSLPLLTINAASGRMYSEGWVTAHAARFAAGEPLYSGDPWHPVNYPPLFFLLLAWLKPLFGDLLLLGRILNFAAFLATAGLAALIVRRLGGGRGAMLLAVAGVVGLQQIQALGWIAANEPQMLAEALLLGGLLCHLHGAPTQRRLAATALLLVAGFLVKHNLIAIPLAIACDLWLRERRLLLAWCLWCGGVAALLVSLCMLAAGGNFVAELLAPRILDLQAQLGHPRRFLITFKIPLGLAILFLFQAREMRNVGLLRVWGAVSLLSATFFSLADGASFNLFLDAAIWLAIIMALAFERWLERLGTSRIQLAAAALLPLLLLQPLVTRLLPSLRVLGERDAIAARYDAASAAFRNGAARLRAHPGLALCDDLLMCYAGGKALTIDPFLARIQILAGNLDEEQLVRRIEEQQFAIIELPTAILLADNATIAPVFFAPPRFTEATLRAIQRRYERSYELVPDGGVEVTLYVPRPR